MINIEDIYPGEVIVSEDKVAEIMELIKSGSKVSSPELVLVDDMYVVRDGNNRVRAWCECHKENYNIEPLNFVMSSQPEPNTNVKEQFVTFARYHGQGVEGFLNMPKYPEDKYQEEHGNVHRKILASSTHSMARKKGLS